MEKLDAGRFTAPGSAPNHFAEHLRTGSLSFGTYSIPAGGLDDQHPHREDEIYVVTTGRAKLVTDSGTVDVGPGDALFVPAGEAHRFTDVTEDLALLVFFAPPYSGALQDVAARRRERLESFGRYLEESVKEYERMTEAEKEEFWARTDTTDYKNLQQMADAGIVLDLDEDQ